MASGKIKALLIACSSREEVNRLKDEYDYIGRRVVLNHKELTVKVLTR
ncbi:hypothetical protein [Gryllotalpicola koreensis]|uniref:Uncharacterized protein n=1 Tax=Gryllotalpicola koreensis TaxID=993086 RepID=A0ABP8A1S4_9MICO